MNIVCAGCTHRDTAIAVREKLAFDESQTQAALRLWRTRFGATEAAILSTCNRVEFYAAAEAGEPPGLAAIADFLAEVRQLDGQAVASQLVYRNGGGAVQHLFEVAASLDSMVVGEPQILSQVKQAYQAAVDADAAGPLLHTAFQAAIAVARRVAAETEIHRHRVSVPSVAVADFARQIFERFDDKHAVVVGAGEMAEETLRYLRDAGVRQLTVVNRSVDRADALAERWGGRAADWSQLTEVLATADLVISTTAAGQPIVDREHFARIERARQGRPLFVLDLAVPRDFDESIGLRPDVYLYSVDDLKAVCERNRAARDAELPRARRIVEQEQAKFAASWNHRATSDVIASLRRDWSGIKENEIERLLHRLPELDAAGREEVRLSFDRLVNKLLHPPLESLRDEARNGVPWTLLDALRRLFQIKD